ncbi:MAG: FG-GAP-like repeat-containing protein, partial [Bacteroidota bacterium]
SFRPDTSGIWPSNTDWTQDLKLADLNGDGNPEIIEGCDQGISNLYLYQNGRYALDNSRLPDAINNTETRKILTGDVDADGDIDLFLCNVGWNPIRNPQDLLFLNDGAANFTNATPTQFPHVHSQTLDGVFMHLNADSLVDLVVTHGDGGQNHATYLNDPAQPGTFQFSDSTFPFFVMNTGIALDTADFDGNGATDVFFGVFQGTDRLLLQERVAAYLEADSHLQLRIFPNPVQDRLRFEVVQLGTIEAAIYDLQGRMIQDNLRLSQQGELDLSDLVPGQYWLRAANGDSLRFEKQ